MKVIYKVENDTKSGNLSLFDAIQWDITAPEGKKDHIFPEQNRAKTATVQYCKGNS